MKLNNSLALCAVMGTFSLCSCADVDTAANSSASGHFKPMYAASYDDTGRALAYGESYLIEADPAYLALVSRGQQFGYANSQTRRFGVAQWQAVSGDDSTWQQDPKQLQASAIDFNKLPPEVNQCVSECKQFAADMNADDGMKQHNELAVAYDRAGAKAAGGAVSAILGGLAGIAGGGSGMEVANVVVPIGANQAIDASSSQDDIQQALTNSASALAQKFGPEYSKMKGELDTLIRKYGAKYPDLLAAITPPTHRS